MHFPFPGVCFEAGTPGKEGTQVRGIEAAFWGVPERRTGMNVVATLTPCL